MDVSDEPGAPQLPVQPVVVALPGRQNVTAVTFDVGEWQALGGKHNVLPAQKQQVLVAGTDLAAKSEAKSQKPKAKTGEQDGVAFTEPNPAIYQSAEPYPANVARWTGTSYRHDSTFVQVLVYPVRYTGAEQRLEVCREVKVKVEGWTNSEARSQKLEARSPDAVSGQRLADSGFEYVIVTGEGYDSVFQRLADWKTQKGVPAVVRTVEWMYANYPGRDQAEQVRNYLKTLPDSGVRYVLLAGDVDVVPFRKAFAMNCEWGSMVREDSLPCDLYFADLDGSWDANGNNVFGEVDDSVDLYADLSVGRAPVSDMTQAQTLVRKVIDYEHGTVPGYENKGLFFAMVLWQNPYTDMGVHKNKMEQQSFASGYSLTKLYQSLGNESRASVMQAMRENQNFLNHDGHGWYDVMSCGEGSGNYLRTADADTITNAGLGIIYSIGCWTTAFDFVSIGEAFVTNPHGGTVATIGNSSYGWGSPGNPGFGYSDKYDNHFWHAITSEGTYRLGDALAAAKEYYAPFSHDKNVYRWHQYDVNLMGDPEMPVWTAQPESLVVMAPLSVGLGSGRYLVTVACAGAPVAGALVCLAGPGEVYSRGLTDAAGRVWLDVDPQTVGWLNLTATAHNFYPYQGEVACDSGNYVNFAGWRVDDRAGNDDGIANPGETVVLPFILRNTGDAPSGAADVRLSTGDSRVTILDSVVSVPGLAPGDSVQIDSGLRVAVEVGPYDGVAVEFMLVVFGGCLARTYFPVLQVGEAVLTLDRTWLNQPPLLPGASRGLGARLENRGHGYGHGTWCRLVSLDSLVVVAKDSVGYGEVQPLSYGSSADSFVVAASSSCPAGHVALMELQTYADRCLERDTLELLVGEYGFEDDMESGEAKWSHGGTGDMWHLTSYRTHSGANAWYCGDEGSRQYNSSMDAWLTTVPFTVPQDCSLRFWRWFATPNYGVDGIRVIVLRGTAEDTLDFVGTGGALGPEGDCPRTGTVPKALVNESGWAEEAYDLSWLGLGETVQVKITFVSDGDTVDEGFYIDDVRVTGGGPPAVGVAGVERASGPVAGLDVWPSPFRRSVRIQCGSALGPEPPQLSVYDASGRMVRRLPSVWSTTWDGRNGSGQLLPAGAYFIEARTRVDRRLVKVLLAR